MHCIAVKYLYCHKKRRGRREGMGGRGRGEGERGRSQDERKKRDQQVIGHTVSWWARHLMHGSSCVHCMAVKYLYCHKK